MATGFSLPKGWKGVSASLVFILPPHLGSASTPVPWLDWAGLGFKAVLLFCGVGNPPFPFSSSFISLPFLSFSPSLFLFPLHLFSFFPPVFFYVSFPFPFFAFFFLSFPFLPPSPLSTRFSILFPIPLSFPFPCFLFLPLAFFLFISISSSMFSSFLSIPVSPLCFHIFFFLSFLLFFFFFSSFPFLFLSPLPPLHPYFFPSFFLSSFAFPSFLLLSISLLSSLHPSPPFCMPALTHPDTHRSRITVAPSPLLPGGSGRRTAGRPPVPAARRGRVQPRRRDVQLPQPRARSPLPPPVAARITSRRRRCAHTSPGPGPCAPGEDARPDQPARPQPLPRSHLRAGLVGPETDINAGAPSGRTGDAYGPGRGPTAGTVFVRRRRGEEGQGRKSKWRQRAAASRSPGGYSRRCRRCCGRGSAGVCARSGPGAAFSSGGSSPSRGERRLAAGAGSGCCSWDPAWKSEKDTPSTTAGSQMKTSGLL